MWTQIKTRQNMTQEEIKQIITAYTNQYTDVDGSTKEMVADIVNGFLDFANKEHLVLKKKSRKEIFMEWYRKYGFVFNDTKGVNPFIGIAITENTILRMYDYLKLNGKDTYAEEFAKLMEIE